MGLRRTGAGTRLVKELTPGPQGFPEIGARPLDPHSNAADLGGALYLLVL